MKYKNLEEYKVAHKARVQSAEFKKVINTFMESLLNEMLDHPISDWLDIMADVAPERNGETEWRKALEAIVCDIRPHSQSIIVKNGKNVRDSFEPATIAEWRKVVTNPIDFPPETIRNIVNQQAIKEIFINVIHDAIITFNKKFNPLAGAMAAFGIEKQIKDFLVPFMDSATKIASDFVTNPSNESMFAEFNGKLFDIAIDQHPDILNSLMDEKREKELWEAIHKTAEDKKFRKLAHEHTLDVIKELKAKAGKKNMREWLKERKITLPFVPLTDKEMGHLTRLMADSDACAKFMFDELQFHNA